MVIGILQPGYLPWLGFFEQLYKSDVFVIYDDVQYDKNGWRNRNRIKTANGIQWLTVPVTLKFQDYIKDVHIDNKTNWRKKHISALKLNYAKSPYLKNYIPIFEEAYAREWEMLIDLDMFFIEKLALAIGIEEKKIIKASDLKIEGGRIDRLMKICKHCGADIFYEGAAGTNYINAEDFASQGIKVEFQDYKHPVYSQPYGDFVPYMSAIDMLFNCGPESLSTLISI